MDGGVGGFIETCICSLKGWRYWIPKRCKLSDFVSFGGGWGDIAFASSKLSICQV